MLASSTKANQLNIPYPFELERVEQAQLPNTATSKGSLHRHNLVSEATSSHVRTVAVCAGCAEVSTSHSCLRRCSNTVLVGDPRREIASLFGVGLFGNGSNNKLTPITGPPSLEPLVGSHRSYQTDQSNSCTSIKLETLEISCLYVTFTSCIGANRTSLHRHGPPGPLDTWCISLLPTRYVYQSLQHTWTCGSLF
jgi:hypothetical protein